MKVFPLLVLGLLLACLTACGERPQNKDQSQISPEQSQQETRKPVVLTPAYEKQQKKEYETRVEAILDGYRKNVEDFKSRAQKGQLKSEAEVETIITGLKVKTVAVSEILAKLKAARLESWQELKPDIHATLDDFETSYDKAVLALVGLEDRPEQQTAHVGAAAAPKGVIPVRVTAESK